MSGFLKGVVLVSRSYTGPTVPDETIRAARLQHKIKLANKNHRAWLPHEDRFVK